MKKLFFLILLFVNINVFANEDLIDLSVNGEKVSCSGYECFIEIKKGSATITYELGENVQNANPSSGHKVSFDNEYSLPIEVEYQDSTKVNYTLTIKKHIESSDNTLKQLIINEEEVLLKDEVYVYSYETKFNDEMIKVSGVCNDFNATCEDIEYEFDLDKSSLSITYPVKAENGDVRNYTIILKRKNKPDTTLKSLTLNDIDFEFDAKKLEYEITIPYSVFKTKINALPNNIDAEVIYEDEEIDLEVGENTIEIKVKNDEVIDTYILKITRLENIDETIANLKKIEIEDCKIKFDANTYEYNLLFKEIPDTLIIKAIPVMEGAKIEIIDNENLLDGSVVSIRVELDNGLSKTYKLNIKLEEEIVKEYNKTLIIILIVVLVIIMIVLLILQIKDNKHNKKNKTNNKIKASNNSKLSNKSKTNKVVNVEEEEIELI